ncbi:ROK family protein [Aquibacillus rhizosphaerae]|uniref:ROK family protein n=1 Tax=Aquibacillus rhizosphaerae TaxID=3051431 RepID=A0ABT7L522_9BACI|nr:ROK family protein [Aquibacillus sp. LR5S19]MDL4840960.1 ROK family protein [Aquibacillus sp. LR5S19]
MEYSIGVDIGGTKVAIALVSAEGEVIEKSIIPTDLSIKPFEMIKRIIAKVEVILHNSPLSIVDLKGIGIGAPGPLDSKLGVITCPPNLRNWVNIPIVEQIKNHFLIPVLLENDANAAALAEKRFGAGKENSNFAYVTISTGIGAGFIVDNQILSGSYGNAGEIGHTVIDPSFGKCSCGQYGCLEFIASGTAIAKKGSEIAGVVLSTKQVFDLYKEGHPKITPFIETVFRTLGVACVSIINSFDPEKIVIGGGVSKVGTPLFDALTDYVSKFALSPAGRETKIVPAELNQNAGVVGAASLCF